MAEGSAAHEPSRAGDAQQQQQDTKEDSEDDDGGMPLLFMEGLPSDFTSNAQLAAIASFMDDSDTEKRGDNDDESDSDDVAPYARASSKRQAKKRDAKCARKQAPYAKSKAAGATSRGDASSAKELQLYLSMFKM